MAINKTTTPVPCKKKEKDATIEEIFELINALGNLTSTDDEANYYGATIQFESPTMINLLDEGNSLIDDFDSLDGLRDYLREEIEVNRKEIMYLPSCKTKIEVSKSGLTVKNVEIDWNQFDEIVIDWNQFDEIVTAVNRIRKEK